MLILQKKKKFYSLIFFLIYLNLKIEKNKIFIGVGIQINTDLVEERDWEIDPVCIGIRMKKKNLFHTPKLMKKKNLFHTQK